MKCLNSKTCGRFDTAKYQTFSYFLEYVGNVQK